MERLGIVDDIRAERARILANVPAAHRARLLGRPAPYAEPKAHAITINLKTGERTVTPVALLATLKPKPPVVKRLSPTTVARGTVWQTEEGKASLRAAELVGPETNPPRVGDIQKAVADAAGMTVAQICSAYRPRRFAYPRQVAILLASELRPDLSLQKIAYLFGNRDHSTAVYAVEVTPGRLKTDAALAEIYIKAKAALGVVK